MPVKAAFVVASHVAQLWVTLQAIGVCLTGSALLVGGPVRFDTPSFRIAALVAPWWCWGLLFLTTGGLMLAAVVTHQRCVLWAAIPPAVMYGLLAGSISYAAILHPHVPLTGPQIYFGMMVLTTVSGVVGRRIFSYNQIAASA